MGLIMLGWMLNMFRNTMANLGIVAASLLLLSGARFSIAAKPPWKMPDG